jgi:hypothetical protein
MKHFINLLVTLILTFFAIGIAYLQVTYFQFWFLLYLPLIIMMVLWGLKLDKDY